MARKIDKLFSKFAAEDRGRASMRKYAEGGEVDDTDAADDTMTEKEARAAGFVPPEEAHSAHDDNTMTEKEARAAGFVPPEEADRSAPAGDDDTMTEEDARAAGYAPPHELKAESVGSGAIRRFAHSVLPATAGIVAGMAGGAAGTAVLPGVGTYAGAIGAGMIASTAVNEMQDWLLKKLGIDDSEQLAANAKTNYWTDEIAGDAASLLTLKPSLKTALSTQGALTAAVLGGVNIAQQEWSTGTIDWNKVGLAAGTGALLNKNTKLGNALIAPAEKFGAKAGNFKGAAEEAPAQATTEEALDTDARYGSNDAPEDARYGSNDETPETYRPGRPDEAVTADGAEDKKAMESSAVSQTAAGGTAQVAAPPRELDEKLVGNSFGTRDNGNSGVYAKKPVAFGKRPNEATVVNDVDPAIAQAINGKSQTSEEINTLVTQLRDKKLDKIADNIQSGAIKPADGQIILDNVDQLQTLHQQEAAPAQGAQPEPSRAPQFGQRTDRPPLDEPAGSTAATTPPTEQFGQREAVPPPPPEEKTPPGGVMAGVDTGPSIPRNIGEINPNSKVELGQVFRGTEGAATPETAMRRGGAPSARAPVEGAPPEPVDAATAKYREDMATMAGKSDFVPKDDPAFTAVDHATMSPDEARAAGFVPPEEANPLPARAQEVIQRARAMGEDGIADQIAQMDPVKAVARAEVINQHLDSMQQPIEPTQFRDRSAEPVQPRTASARQRLGDAVRGEPLPTPEVPAPEVLAPKEQSLAARNRTEAERIATARGEDVPDGAKEAKWGALASLAKRFAGDESGSVPMPEFLKRKPTLGDLTYRTQEARTPAELARMSYEDKLNVFDKMNIVGARQWLQRIKEIATNRKTDVDVKLRARLAEARDNLQTDPKALDKLSVKDREVYDRVYKPIFDENDAKAVAIRARDADILGPEVVNHLQRIVSGGGRDDGEDVITGHTSARDIPTKKSGPGFDRRFVALERQSDGKRVVISLGDSGGFTMWKGYKATKIDNPDFEYTPNKLFTAGRTKYVMKDATMAEIEANANGKNGKPMKYERDALASAVETGKYLDELKSRMDLVESFKADPVFNQFANLSKSAGEANWEQTSLPQFSKYYMDPQLKAVFDQYHSATLASAKGLDALRRFNQRVLKLLFWLPTAHINNVGTHWVSSRGWDWMNPIAYGRLATTSMHAIKSVLSQDSYQDRMMQHGAGLMYGGVLTRDFGDKFARTVGKEMQTNPSQWAALAEKFGMPVKKLYDGIYEQSSKVMWAANDIMLTQAAMEREAKGMTLKDAIIHAERDIPNYRVPASILTHGQGGILMSKIMTDPALFSFGRYHYGMINAWGNIVKDLTSGDGGRSVEAVGKLMAIGLMQLMYAYPLKKLAEKITGNKNAEFTERGPLTIPGQVAKVYRGQGSYTDALRSTLARSPAFQAVPQLFDNANWAGKAIFEPADQQAAMHGSLKGAANLVAQGATYGARLIAPINTAEQGAQKNQSPYETVRNQALDIKQPSAKGAAYQQKLAKINRQKAQRRHNHPDGLLEKLTYKLTR